MTYQTQSLVEVAFKVQSGLGSLASGSSATLFRPSGGSGLSVAKQLIQSNEIRADGQQTRGRHGSRQAPGSYEAELSVGTFDAILEAIWRGTWDASALTITNATASLGAVTTGTHTFTSAGGSWITAGLVVGDVIVPTNFAETTNNSRNLRVTAVTATVLTVAETLTAATSDASWTITRSKKLINPAAGALVTRYFTISERGVDIDAEEVFEDCKFGSFRLSLGPNGMAACTVGVVGRDAAIYSGSSSPYFTSPTATSSVPLAVTDATIRLGSTDLVDISALDLTCDIGLTAPPVLGNSGLAPDVFAGSFSVAGSMTLLLQDLARVQSFLDEDEFSLWVTLSENEAAPEDFVSFFLPSITLGGAAKSALARAGGPRTITVPLVIGAKPVTSGWDASTVTVQRSNA